MSRSKLWATEFPFNRVWNLIKLFLRVKFCDNELLYLERELNSIYQVMRNYEKIIFYLTEKIKVRKKLSKYMPAHII